MENKENIIKEYLGMAFIQSLKEYCKEHNTNFESGWYMQDKNYKFLRFDLEYAYYQRIK